MRRAESLLSPEDRYADGLWMLPTRIHSSPQWWDAFTLREDRRALTAGDDSSIREFFENRPKVWITNYRVALMEDVLAAPLRASYVPVDRGILLSGAMLTDAKPTRFVNRWPGRYALFDGIGRATGGEISIDGSKRETPVMLVEGPQEIASSTARADEPLFLLPADFVGPARLPAPAWGPDLFAGVYDY